MAYKIHLNDIAIFQRCVIEKLSQTKKCALSSLTLCYINVIIAIM